jgi:hypothetical protein
MDTNTQSGQETPKYELKEFIDADQFKGLLKAWLYAMENDEDLMVNVKGRDCIIPKEAFETGKFRSEYEIDKGEYEFELQLKWRSSESNTKQL